MTHPQYLVANVRNRKWIAGPAAFGVLALCLGALPSAVRAEPAPLPKAEAVLDRYIEVTGGRAAYEKIRNRVTKERVEFVGMDIEDRATTYAAPPNLRYFSVESEAMGPVWNGTNGDIVWYLSDGTGPQVETGAARDAILDAWAFPGLLNWRERYKQVECVGVEALDGRDCYKLNMIPKHGEPETRYFDKQSGLLVRSIVTRPSSFMPTVKVEMRYDEYKKVDGLLIPHVATQKYDMCGSTREMRFVTDNIQHNVELPADRFNPPKEILEQAKKIAEGKVDTTKPQRKCGPSGQGAAGATSQPADQPKGAPGCGGGKP